MGPIPPSTLNKPHSSVKFLQYISKQTRGKCMTLLGAAEKGVNMTDVLFDND